MRLTIERIDFKTALIETENNQGASRAHTCLIAQAFKRQTGKNVTVGNLIAHVRRADGTYTGEQYTLDRDARLLISAFDGSALNGEEFPVTLELIPFGTFATDSEHYHSVLNNW